MRRGGGTQGLHCGPCREAVLKMKRVEVNYNTDQPKFLQDSGSDTQLHDMPIEHLIDRI